MPEAIGVEALFLSTLAGAAVVLFGALYALFFALGRLRDSRRLVRISLAAYVMLAVAVSVLAVSLRLDGFWLAVVAVLLVGYFAAPRAIWHLCVGTHGDESGELAEGAVE